MKKKAAAAVLMAAVTIFMIACGGSNDAGNGAEIGRAHV